MSTALEPPLAAGLDTTRPSGGCRPNGAEVLNTDVLVAIAAGLAEVSPPWDLRPGSAADGHHHRRLLSTPGYDAWIVRWPPGTSVGLHAHGESAGALAIVDGHLEETTYELGQTLRRALEAGHVSTFDTGCVHGVANRGSRPATSVHVYSPPIASRDHLDAPDAHDAGDPTDHWDPER